MESKALSYSPIEVSGWLPAGWTQQSSGEWSERRATWSIRVRDGADQDWDLDVSAADAQEHGRSGALKRAMDRLYREALG